MPKEITSTALKKLIANDNILLLDVRSSEAHKKDGLDNSINIPIDSLREEHSILAKDKIIVVFCNRGITSARACDLLDKFGFSNVMNLSGGVTSWYKDKRVIIL